LHWTKKKDPLFLHGITTTKTFSTTSLPKVARVVEIQLFSKKNNKIYKENNTIMLSSNPLHETSQQQINNGVFSYATPPR